MDEWNSAEPESTCGTQFSSLAVVNYKCDKWLSIRKMWFDWAIDFRSFFLFLFSISSRWKREREEKMEKTKERRKKKRRKRRKRSSGGGGGGAGYWVIIQATCAVILWLNSNHPAAFVQRQRYWLLPRPSASHLPSRAGRSGTRMGGRSATDDESRGEAHAPIGNANNETKLWLVAYWSLQ